MGGAGSDGVLAVAIGCVGRVGSPLPLVGVAGGHLIGPAMKDGSWSHGSSVGRAGAPVLLPMIPRVTRRPDGVFWVPGVACIISEEEEKDLKQ